MQQMLQEHKMPTIEFFNVREKAGHLSRFFISGSFNAGLNIL
mgnify:CR=1 FL=1